MSHLFSTTQMLSSYQVYVSTLLCELTLFAILVIVLGVLAETVPLLLVNYKYRLLKRKLNWKCLSQRTNLKSTETYMTQPQQVICETKQQNANCSNINNNQEAGHEKAKSLQIAHANESNMSSNLHQVEREQCRDCTCCEQDYEHTLESEHSKHDKHNYVNDHVITQEDAVIHEIIPHFNNHKARNNAKHKNSAAETDVHPVKNGLLHNTLDSFFDMEGLLDEALTESMSQSAQVQQNNNSMECKTKSTNNIQNATDRLSMQQMARPFASRRRRQN